jgi:trans-aconitate 2-methyltransferase
VTGRSPWDPALYERFAAEREQPFHDLADLVEARPGMRVLDLGCGTGRLTRGLHKRLGAVRTLGVDSSGSMLAESAAFAGDGVSFQLGDLSELHEPSTWDLVFSNAALQWVEDHPSALERLARLLAPGGQLAIQVPANDVHPSHMVARELAASEPWITRLGGWERRWSVLEPEDYARQLHRLGAVTQRVRLVVYPHVLARPEDVVSWVQGTLLTPYRDRLDPIDYRGFLGEYRAMLMPLLHDERPYFYPFRRILLHARFG